MKPLATVLRCIGGPHHLSRYGVNWYRTLSTSPKALPSVSGGLPSEMSQTKAQTTLKSHLGPVTKLTGHRRAPRLPHWDFDVLRRLSFYFETNIQPKGRVMMRVSVPLTPTTAHALEVAITFDEPSLIGRRVRYVPFINRDNYAGIWLYEVVGDPTYPANRLLKTRSRPGRGSISGTLYHVDLDPNAPSWARAMRDARDLMRPTITETAAELSEDTVIPLDRSGKVAISPETSLTTFRHPFVTPRPFQYPYMLHGEWREGRSGRVIFRRIFVLLDGHLQRRKTEFRFSVPQSWGREPDWHPCQIVWHDDIQSLVIHERDVGPHMETSLSLDNIMRLSHSEAAIDLLVAEGHIARKDLYNPFIPHYSLDVLRPSFCSIQATVRDTIMFDPSFRVRGLTFTLPQTIIKITDHRLEGKTIRFFPYLTGDNRLGLWLREVVDDATCIPVDRPILVGPDGETSISIDEDEGWNMSLTSWKQVKARVDSLNKKAEARNARTEARRKGVKSKGRSLQQ